MFFICRSPLEKCRPFSHSRKIGQKKEKPADIRVPLLPALALLSFPTLLSTFLSTLFFSITSSVVPPSHKASSAYASSARLSQLSPVLFALWFSWFSGSLGYPVGSRHYMVLVLTTQFAQGSPVLISTLRFWFCHYLYLVLLILCSQLLVGCHLPT